MKSGRKPNKQHGGKNDKPKGKGGKGGKDKDGKGKMGGGGGGGSGGAAARLPSTGYRAAFARSLRSFLNDPTKRTVTMALPDRQELVGVYEVTRILGLHLRLDETRLTMLVSKKHFCPAGKKDGDEESSVADAPATMEDWVGVIWAILARAGGALKASDLFAAFPRLKALFLARFPAPGPVLKAGVAAGVLDMLKIPGAVFVQIKNVAPIIDVETAVVVVVERKKKAEIVLAPKPKAFEHNRAPIAVAAVVAVAVMEEEKKKADLAKAMWLCGVCEQENDLGENVCILCLSERE